MTDRPARDERREGVFRETAGEYAEGALGDEAFGGSRRWGGYSSDQGEPGDAEDFGTAAGTSSPDDASIMAEVCRGLEREVDLDARDIAVDVVAGEVVLQGSVGSEDARGRAERIARGAPGARGIRNELAVRRGELDPPDDRGHTG